MQELSKESLLELIRTEPNQASSRAKGYRLRFLRLLANYTRSEIAEISKVSSQTYKGWELGKHGGLTGQGTKKLLPAIQAKHVQVTPEWLMTGAGLVPKVDEHYRLESFHDIKKRIAKLPTNITEDERIQTELDGFHQLNPNTIDLIVPDISMHPHYQMGDLVAGIKLVDKCIKRAINKDCIVQLQEGQIYFRRIQPGDAEGTYTLFTLNTAPNIKKFICNVKLVFAAPIIWHRRRSEG